MRLAKNAFLTTLVMLALLVTVSAQTRRSAEDDRNIAPTVGTGGTPGGPTGLFTVYDGQTLRRGEFTFSAAYSRFARDPGNVTIKEIPLSFQIGVSDRLEFFFNTDGYRWVEVNNPENLSSFYLPNSSINGVSPAAIVYSYGATDRGAIFRPAGTQPFCQYPYTGCSGGNLGFTQLAGNPFLIGTVFGFNSGVVSLGPPRAGGGDSSSADNFPGVGSIYGGILPGIVLSTQTLAGGATRPLVYTAAPSYLPDAPFINRLEGESSFSTYTVGAKWRFNGPEDSWGVGIVPFYRFYADQADTTGGFNMLQRGSSPGGGSGNPFSGTGRGDLGVTMFFDSRLARWVNLSLNVGYIFNSSVRAEIGGEEVELLDRPDEFHYQVGLDFPVNKYFQPILEFKQTRYTGGRTPNAFQNNPMDGIAGIRVFPARWIGFSAAYRHHFNQQDQDAIEDIQFSQNVIPSITVLNSVNSVTGVVVGSPVTSSGPIFPAFRPSSDPHGFIFQFFAGHRHARGNPPIVNVPANVTAVDLDRTTITLPCVPPQVSRSGGCADSTQTVGVRTTAVDPEGDVLTYSYTVSGGRITGSGANVGWDVSGLRPGTYTITSAVDDGCGFCGTPKTTQITVVECPDCYTPAPPCSCPDSFGVTASPQQAAPGDTITFTANVTGGTQSNVTYNWSVSAGSISEGQGTPVIRVSTAGLENTSVTATVEIGGLCDICTDRSRSETASVAGIPRPRLVDEVTGVINLDDLRNRVDNFITQLQSEPTSTGVIINYGTDKEVARREADIRKQLTFRNLPADRVRFVRGGTDPGIRTRFFIVPAGAADPEP